MTILLAIARQLGLVGCAVLGLLAFYEGVPGVRDIPGLSSIPLLRDLTVGRVKIVADQAVRDATAGLVNRSELVTAQQRADELDRQLKQNAEFAKAAQRQLDQARTDADAAREALEKSIAEDTDPDISRWTSRDLERLRQR
jgi:hypothetical protein